MRLVFGRGMESDWHMNAQRVALATCRDDISCTFPGPESFLQDLQ